MSEPGSDRVPVGKVVGWAVLAAICVYFVVLHGAVGVRTESLSTLDEAAHLSYLDETRNHRFTLNTASITEAVRTQRRCDRGTGPRPQQNLTAECLAAPGPPEFNHQAQHLPLYYAATAVGQWVVDRFATVDRVVVGGRLGSLPWLAAGAVMVWALLAEFGIPLTTRAITLILLLSTGGLINAHAFVNNDATALVAGATVAWCAIRVNRGSLHAWWLVAAAALAICLKGTNLSAAVGAMVLLAVWRPGVPRATEPAGPSSSILARHRALFACAAGGVAGLGLVKAYLAFIAARSGRDRGQVLEYFHRSMFPDSVLGNITSAISNPLAPQMRVSVLQHLGASPLEYLTTFCFLVAPVVALVLARSTREPTIGRLRFAAAAAAVVVLCSFQLGWLTLSLASGDAVGNVPPRYALAIAPLMAVSLATVIEALRAVTWPQRLPRWVRTNAPVLTTVVLLVGSLVVAGTEMGSVLQSHPPSANGFFSDEESEAIGREARHDAGTCFDNPGVRVATLPAIPRAYPYLGVPKPHNLSAFDRHRAMTTGVAPDAPAALATMDVVLLPSGPLPAALQPIADQVTTTFTLCATYASFDIDLGGISGRVYRRTSVDGTNG